MSQTEQRPAGRDVAIVTDNPDGRGVPARPVAGRGSAAEAIRGLGNWRALPLPRLAWDSAVQSRALLGAELVAVVLWAAFITRPYLNMDAQAVPMGGEYASAIQANHLWTRVRESGWAGMWNGSQRGGFPAFAELHGSMLHPLVILTSLGFGVPNGAKLALVGAFAIAGLAQWWLAWLLGLGRAARVWSAFMVVVGGHLAARMELGAFGAVLGTVSFALVLPTLLLLARTHSRRHAILLGVALALFALSAEGYLQVGSLFVVPAVVLLARWQRDPLLRLARRGVLAVALALLLAAPLLVPFLHFMPEFQKSAVDPTFSTAQPFTITLLNLVIGDHQFYTTQSGMVKVPYPWLYVNFLGWVPAVLALWGVRGSRSGEERKERAFLAAVALLVLWVSSAGPLAWLVAHVPSPALAETLAGVRYPSILAGLAVPAILALAAIGVDQLVRAPWPLPRFRVTVSDNGSAIQLASPDPRWLLMVPLVLSLTAALSFGSRWIATGPESPEIRPVLESLRTPDLQWVNPPFGEHRWIEPAVGMGLKLSQGFQAWQWKGRPFPEAVLAASRDAAPPGWSLKARLGGMPIYAAPPGLEYAAVTHPEGGRTVVSARGGGGDIDVSFDVPRAGTLVVKENSWTGWQAQVDGQPVPLRPGRWLSVDVPAGSHTVQFRYRPWDVPVGILLSLVGLGLAAHQWRRGDETECT